jgi:hypothetical protein
VPKRKWDSSNESFDKLFKRAGLSVEKCVELVTGFAMDDKLPVRDRMAAIALRHRLGYVRAKVTIRNEVKRKPKEQQDGFYDPKAFDGTPLPVTTNGKHE